MPGGRKTHDFPHGKPLALVVTEIVFVATFVAWMIFGGFFEGWRRAVPFIAVIVAVLFVYSNLIRTYERTGQAVPIRRPKVIVKFAAGLPAPMLAARIAFFVTVAIMVLLGVGPVTDSTARVGIIACVFALIGVAVLNIALEHHYVRTGRGSEVDLSVQSVGRNRD